MLMNTKPRHHDQREKQKHYAIEGIGQPVDIVVIKGHGGEHSDQTEPQPCRLARRQRAGVLRAHIVVGAVDRGHAYRDKRQREKKQRPVEVRDQAPINLHGSLLRFALPASQSLSF